MPLILSINNPQQCCIVARAALVALATLFTTPRCLSQQAQNVTPQKIPCDVSRLKAMGLIGKPYSQELQEQARRASGAQLARPARVTLHTVQHAITVQIASTFGRIKLAM